MSFKKQIVMPIAMALLCALTFTTTSALHAQEGPISGQVVDQNTGEGALLALGCNMVRKHTFLTLR